MFKVFSDSGLSFILWSSSGTKQKPIPVQKLSKADNAFLENLSKRLFQYFGDRTDLKNGLTLDRTTTDGQPKVTREGQKMASRATTGFAVTSLKRMGKSRRNWH